MFSIVHRSTPWKKADKKKRYSDGNPSQTVPLHMYEELQLKLIETIDVLAERDSTVSSLDSQVKVHKADATVSAYKIETLENTIKEKDSEIEKLRRELSVLRGSGSSTHQDSKRQESKREKKEKEKKSKRQSKSKSNQSGSHGVKKSGQKKKKARKRITMHNHELSKTSEKCREGRSLSTSKHGSVGSSSADSSNRAKSSGSHELTEAQPHAVVDDEVDDASAGGGTREEPLDDSMHSHLCFSPGPGQGLRRRSLPPSHRFWNFRHPRLISPVADGPFLDPSMLEMIDEVSDLTRSYRSEFSVSIWSPSPIVKRREIVMSEDDKDAIGVIGLGENALPIRQSSLRSLPLVDEQSGGSLDCEKRQTGPHLSRSNSMKERMSKTWWQVDEISTVHEEIEEEIMEDSDAGDEGIFLHEEVLEDDSIALSSMSC